MAVEEEQHQDPRPKTQEVWAGVDCNNNARVDVTAVERHWSFIRMMREGAR